MPDSDFIACILSSYTLQNTLYLLSVTMIIVGVKHKGLRRLLRNNDTSGLPATYVNKIRNIIAFLQDMQTVDELYSVPTWKAHTLSGKREGLWSLFVSRNWRITFRINDTEIEIFELIYEDYH